MPTYVVKTFPSHSISLTDELNAMAGQGWRLHTFTRDDRRDEYVAVFER